MFKKYSNFMFWKENLKKVLQNHRYFNVKLVYFFEKIIFRSIDIVSSVITLHDFIQNIKYAPRKYLQFAKKTQIKTSNIEQDTSPFVDTIKKAEIQIVSPFWNMNKKGE